MPALPVALRRYLKAAYLAGGLLLLALARHLVARPRLSVPHDYEYFSLALAAILILALRAALRTIRQADRRAAALHRVLDTSKRLRLRHSQEDLLQYVAEAAHTLTGAAMVAAYLPDEEDPALLKRVVVVPSDVERAGSSHLLVPTAGAGMREEIDESGRTLLAPLELDETGVIGLLLLAGVPAALASDECDALSLLIAEASIALENAQLHARALAQASQDGLTGLLNHRAFQARLAAEVERTRRGGQPLALLMVDLDNFGAVNNTYGHQAGDAALAAVAAVLRASARIADVPARYGGDEFVVILPETTLDEALLVAERTRAAIAARVIIEGGAARRVDASIGVAALPAHGQTGEELIRAADQAAYAAKHAGKGRVSRPEDAALRLDHDPAIVTTQLQNANLATVEALAAAVDAKDPYTRGHSQRVSAYAAALARAMALPDADVARVRLAGLLHDVGKIGVPDAILTKPGRLSDAEFAVLRQHPVIGERMLSTAPFLREILPAVRHHHERWDGRGYPDRLEGAAIPCDAAIIMVADSFDAMTSSRTYRPALPFGEARRRLREGSGTQYDPRVVAAFEQAVAAHTLRPLSSDKTTQLAPERMPRAS